jgi:epoxyqueuosine reductase QueG
MSRINTETRNNNIFYRQIASKLLEYDVSPFGVANLQGISTLIDSAGRNFPRAISFAVRMNPDIMAGIRTGPTQAYADEYARANKEIDRIAASLVTEIQAMGFEARTFKASQRTDQVKIKGEFPHKTAATLAGLGWVGRSCLLITRKFGPWVRLGTVFTHLPVTNDAPKTKSFCGKCRECVDACPAGAIVGNHWKPGIPRKKLLDALCCDKWKKEHYYRFHKGHNCGICAAVCPFGG